MTFIMSSEIVTQDASVTSMVLSGLMLAMLAVATVLTGRIQSRTRRTEEAVHDEHGQSISDQMTAFEKRLDGTEVRVGVNEARMTDMSGRLGLVETSAAAAHRRIDQLTTGDHHG